MHPLIQYTVAVVIGILLGFWFQGFFIHQKELFSGSFGLAVDGFVGNANKSPTMMGTRTSPGRGLTCTSCFH